MAFIPIDPKTNPAQNNWLSYYIAEKTNVPNIALLTQENFDSITSIIISYKDLMFIPNQIENVRNLYYLFLPNTQIDNIPSVIGNLKNLNTLALFENNISYIPNELGLLTNLSELDLDSNHITSIPESIYELSNLSSLGLSHNNISSMSESISKLKKLNYLNLSYNPISSIPDNLYLLPKLSRLFLEYCGITSLPDAFSLLSNLNQLSLSGNPLISLPSNIEKLSQLQYIYLNDCNLVYFPKELFQMKPLRTISLFDNYITFIPDEIANLSNLGLLNLGYNQITHISDYVSQYLPPRGGTHLHVNLLADKNLQDQLMAKETLLLSIGENLTQEDLKNSAYLKSDRMLSPAHEYELIIEDNSCGCLDENMTAVKSGIVEARIRIKSDDNTNPRIISENIFFINVLDSMNIKAESVSTIKNQCFIATNQFTNTGTVLEDSSYKSLMKFNIRELPYNITIMKAVLNIYVSKLCFTSSEPGSHTVYLDYNLQDYKDSSLYNIKLCERAAESKKPCNDIPPAKYTNINFTAQNTGYISLDITELVRSWYSYLYKYSYRTYPIANFGITLRGVEDELNTLIQYHSLNNENPPYITVNYYPDIINPIQSRMNLSSSYFNKLPNNSPIIFSESSLNTLSTIDYYYSSGTFTINETGIYSITWIVSGDTNYSSYYPDNIDTRKFSLSVNNEIVDSALYKVNSSVPYYSVSQTTLLSLNSGDTIQILNKSGLSISLAYCTDCLHAKIVITKTAPVSPF